MPIPAAVIAGGMSILSQGMNAAFQGGMNRRSREWNEAMYARQRRDALMDRDYQNWYDSPSQQMERLKAADINPRLAYSSGVQNQGSVVRSTNMDAWNPVAPQFDAGSVMGAYFDTEMKQAQVDNLKAQNDVIRQEAILKAMETAVKEDTHTMNQNELSVWTELKRYQLDMAREMVNKVKADTAYRLDENERQALRNVQSIQEGVERILTLRQGRKLSTEQIRSIRQDVELKRLDIELRRKWNLSPSDPLWIRIITPFLEKFGVGE